MLHAIEHVFDADDVQVAFLLTGERRVRQVLGGGRRAHGEGSVRLVRRQARELLADILLECRLQRRVDDPLTDLGAGFREGLDVVDVEALETLGNALGQVVVLEEFAEGVRRRGEAARHAHAGAGQLADHFAKRCILAADRLDVGHAQMLKRHHVGAVVCCVSHKSP